MFDFWKLKEKKYSIFPSSLELKTLRTCSSAVISVTMHKRWPPPPQPLLLYRRMVYTVSDFKIKYVCDVRKKLSNPQRKKYRSTLPPRLHSRVFNVVLKNTVGDFLLRFDDYTCRNLLGLRDLLVTRCLPAIRFQTKEAKDRRTAYSLLTYICFYRPIGFDFR